jgi:hypothetical protein
MHKNTTYKEKFTLLKEIMPVVIDSVKKDLKNEHLKKDFYFVKKFLGAKNLNKLTTEELTEAYQKAIEEEEKGEDLAEFVTSRWLMKNSELYEFFENQLTVITPDFTDLEELSMQQAQPLVEASITEFGALKTYLFAVLNSVVFPNEIFQKLELEAKKQSKQDQEQEQLDLEKLNVDNMKKAFAMEIARLTDKYEKKLSGLQKKYIVDVECLKKQISHLQRKLQGKEI